jgi:hypothetical protein
VYLYYKHVTTADLHVLSEVKSESFKSFITEWVCSVSRGAERNGAVENSQRPVSLETLGTSEPTNTVHTVLSFMFSYHGTIYSKC